MSRSEDQSQSSQAGGAGASARGQQDRPETSAQRALRARIAAHTLWAHMADPAAHTAPARAAFLDRFERQVDPDGTLPVDERTRRAQHARRAYFLALAARSVRTRRRRARAREDRAAKRSAAGR